MSVLAHAPAPGVAGPPPEPAAARPRARWVPYVLLAPGLVWLSLFFILPTITLVSTSLQTGSLATGYSQTFEIGNYTSAWSAYYPQLIRSFLYAGAATLAALAIGIGVPYTIHLARRFEEERTEMDNLEEAIRSTTTHTGGALAGSAFTTMAGFGILVTSSLVPFRQMGQVTVFAIGLALVASILVLPSMLVLWERWHRRGR